MCEPIDNLMHLDDVWFKVASLQDVMPLGDLRRHLAKCVVDSVRQDIERIQRQWRAERKELEELRRGIK